MAAGSKRGKKGAAAKSSKGHKKQKKQQHAANSKGNKKSPAKSPAKSKNKRNAGKEPVKISIRRVDLVEKKIMFSVFGSCWEFFDVRFLIFVLR